MTYHAKLIKGGKIVIPADLRRELGFHEGDTLVFERDGESIRITTYQQTVREVQAEFKSLVPGGDTVEEFLADRRGLWGGE